MPASGGAAGRVGGELAAPLEAIQRDCSARCRLGDRRRSRASQGEITAAAGSGCERIARLDADTRRFGASSCGRRPGRRLLHRPARTGLAERRVIAWPGAWIVSHRVSDACLTAVRDARAVNHRA